MNEYRYTLEPYKGINTRYDCPSCGEHNKFSRYIDTETGDHLHPTVGRCDREKNCGHHYTPKQYFQDNNLLLIQTQQKSTIKPKTYIIPQPNLVSYRQSRVQNRHELHFGCS